MEETTNKISVALQALAVKETKTQMIRNVLPDIENCKKKGISNKVIAETLSVNGLEIDQKTLASLMSRVKKEDANKSPQKSSNKSEDKT